VDHVHSSELLGAYVLDSCGDAEADEIRLHIQRCTECTEEIDRFVLEQKAAEEVAVRLALQLPPA
jgi:hypothetical protein